jgi:hypothetical protein
LRLAERGLRPRERQRQPIRRVAAPCSTCSASKNSSAMTHVLLAEDPVKQSIARKASSVLVFRLVAVF